MMEAIMEFTSAGHMPSVFKDNAGPPVEAATLLPARMDNNQLHRYSKVQSKCNLMIPVPKDVTGLIAYSDTLGTRERCHSKNTVTLSRGIS